MNEDRPQIGDLRPVSNVVGMLDVQLFGYTVNCGRNTVP